MIPIAVRLSNKNADMHITNRVTDVMWRTVIPGGYASATFELQQPIDINDPLLAAFTRVYIYDSRSGEVEWEGRLQVPGRTAGDQGNLWSLTAIGPSAHATDRLEALVYIDKDLSRWVGAPGNSASALAGVDGDPLGGNASTLKVQYPPGHPVGSTSKAGVRYTALSATFGMELGAFRVAWQSGKTDTNYAMQVVTGLDDTVFIDTVLNFTITGNATRIHTAFIVDDFPVARNQLVFRLARVAGGSTTVADDNSWTQAIDFRVLGRRVLKDGTPVSGGAGMETTTRVRAHQVVADLLGRPLLPLYDGANASLATNTFDIDQLAYTEPVTPQVVLDDLMLLEPLFYWAAWESNAAGLNRFEWKQWPTTVRYQATAVDGFDSPAPALEQFSRVAVRWKDADGTIQNTFRSQAIPELDNEGIFRESFTDLGDEVGSSTNAVKSGDEYLAEHRYPPSAGTLTLAQPVLDLLGGRMVDPWQVKPGELIRVNGLDAPTSTLDATARDGANVFKVVSMTTNGDGIATLELDVFTPTQQRLLADLVKTRYTRPAMRPRRV